MSLNRYLKSHTLQFHSVYQSDTAFLIIRDKDNIFSTTCNIRADELCSRRGWNESGIRQTGDAICRFFVSPVNLWAPNIDSIRAGGLRRCPVWGSTSISGHASGGARPFCRRRGVDFQWADADGIGFFRIFVVNQPLLTRYGTNVATSSDGRTGRVARPRRRGASPPP